jgi:hypothetical protein
VDELEKEEKKVRVQHIDYLSLCVDTLALGSEAKPGHWKCPVKNESEVGDCIFTDVQANNVEQKLPEIIDQVLKLHTSSCLQGWKYVVLRHPEHQSYFKKNKIRTLSGAQRSKFRTTFPKRRCEAFVSHELF